jgi:hypothetical protein
VQLQGKQIVAPNDRSLWSRLGKTDSEPRPQGAISAKARTFLIIALAGSAWAQSSLPLEPYHDAGQSITGAFEGWFANADGSFSLLAGYYNRNQKQTVEVPIGPNNRIEPGGPDQGQPTLFLPGRQWGVFTVTVPKDFGEKKLTWTLVVNGKTNVIPISLHLQYEVSPFKDASDNTPPFIGFSESGPFVQGPNGQSISLTATVASPLTLAVWVADDAKSQLPAGRFAGPPVTVAWSKFRGPGTVTFANERPAVQQASFKAPPPAIFSGTATTTAQFSAPGEYVLRVVANDASGDGGRGFQCCWTNARVKITVK